MTLWVFTCIFDFLRCVALFYHVLQCVHTYYVSHNIIPTICLWNLSVLHVKTQFFDCFWLFLIVSSKYQLQPVSVAGCLFLGPKTGPDWMCEH